MSAARGYEALSFEEYLALEASSTDVRHGLVGGTAFALTGGTLTHARLVTRLALIVGRGISGSGCRLYVADARLRVGDLNSYYPTSDHYGTSPSIVAEVLSRSTAAIDRREKRLVYLQVPTLEQYLIVDPVGTVEVWTPDATFPAIEWETVRWQPAGAAGPFSLSRTELFQPI